MAEYRIFETDQFETDLQAIAKAGYPKVRDNLRIMVYAELRKQPYFGPNIRKLKGYSPDTWRYRIGSWRFFYETDDAKKTIFMVAASHR